MIIERLDLIAFGQLTDVSIDLSAGPNRFHMILGRNESGKSTTMRAIDAWLFGFPPQTKDAFLHPMNKLRVGGVLRTGNDTLACIRKKGRTKTLLDGFGGKTPISEDRLLSILGGVDQSTFGTQFLLGHEELVSGGKLVLRGEGDLGEMLFAAAAGLGRLQKTRDLLRADEETLLRRRGKSKIGDAIQAAKQTREALKLAQFPPVAYAKLQREIADKKIRIAQLKQDRDSIVVDRSRQSAWLEALPILPQWQTLSREVENVAEVPSLPEDFSERRRKLSSDIAVNQNNLRRLQQSLDRVGTERRQLVLDPSVLKHRSQIESLRKQLPAFEKSELERTGYLTKAFHDKDRQLQQRLADLASQSGVPLPEDADLAARAGRFHLSETQRNRIARLANGYARIVAQVEASRKVVDRLKQRLADAEAQLARIDVAGDLDQRAKLLEQTDDPATLTKRYGEAVSKNQQAMATCQKLAERLGVAMPSKNQPLATLPDSESIEFLTDQLRRENEELQRLTRIGSEWNLQLEQLRSESQAAQVSCKLPSADSLRTARKHRDQLLDKFAQRIAATTTRERFVKHAEDADADVDAEDVVREGAETDDGNAFDLASLIQSVRHADEIIDQLRLHHVEVAQRERMAGEIETLLVKITRNQSAVQQQRQLLQHTQQRWDALWSPLGITAKSPAAMRDWSSDYEKLVRQTDTLDETRLEIEWARRAIDYATEHLYRVVSGEESRIDEEAFSDQGELLRTLAALHAKADSLVRQQVQARDRRDGLAQRMAEWEFELREVEETFVEATGERTDWQQRWDAATQSLRTISPLPDDVVPMLDAIKDLEVVQQARADLAERIALIETETRSFVHSVDRLLGDISASSETTPSTPATAMEAPDESGDLTAQLRRAATDLDNAARRLEIAVDAAATDGRLKQQADDLQSELDRELETAQRHNTLSDDLCREAGCQSMDQLPEVETQSRQRQALLAKLRQAEIDLRRLSGNDSVESLIEAISDVSPAMLESEIQDLQRQHAQVSKELETETQALGALNHRMRQIDGSAKASALSQTLASQLGQIGHDAEQYVRLRLAGGILQRAIEHYRAENQEPVMQVAAGFFRELTSGDYVGLQVEYDDKDRPVLYGVRDGRDDVPAPAMSAGTADLLYLALRLASLKLRCQQGKPMLLIVDDCLQQLDDDRAVAALKVLSQLSLDTQVILFTHHWHLAGLAKKHLEKTAVHFHELAG